MDAGPHIAELNSLLRERWRTRLARSYVRESGGLAEFTEGVTFLSDRWLVLEEMELPDGYAWSSAAAWHETWNLKTGKRVDLWSWFNPQGGNWHPSESNPSGGAEFRPSAALLARAKRLVTQDPDCAGKDVDLDDPRLSPTGIQFSTGSGPCKQVFVLTFALLRPFLNQEGVHQATH
jgi:hypothetical protein